MMRFVYVLLTLGVSVDGAATDIRIGKVRNKHLTWFICTWMLACLCESIANHSIAQLNPGFCVNFVFCFAASLVLYLTDIWAPGDAKLMMIISVIYPMELYIVPEGNVFPTLNIIVFSFALGYVWLLITAVHDRIKGKTHERSSGAWNGKKSLPAIALSFATNTGFVSGIKGFMNMYASDFIYANQALSILAIILISFVLHSKAHIIMLFLSGIGWVSFIACMIIQSIPASQVSYLLAQGFIVALIIEYLNSQLQNNSYISIDGKQVQPGMILSLATVWDMQKCIDPDIPHSTTETRRSRITPAQAIAVQKWAAKTNRKITVVEMLPFAPFIAAAVCVEITRYLIICYF